MSSNKVKKGWKKTYERNDADDWKKAKHHIIKNFNAVKEDQDDERFESSQQSKKPKK